MSDIKMSYDKNTALRIKDFLLKQSLTIEGAYGMMANIYSESGFRSNNAQNSYMTKMGMTDESYTAQVDHGQYNEFCTDKVGYGLCQWTSSGRKTGLFNYAKEQSKSISDEAMQLNYLMKELTTSYKSTLNILKTSHDISECAKYVMTQFERPADQSDTAQNKRASYGLQLYKDLENKKEETNMSYTNSSLVNYTLLSPNCSKPRNNKITKIVIHHMAGNLTVEACGKVFQPTSRQASSNYGVGTDGRVGMYVEECNRAWTSGNATIDNQAITIEVANDVIGGNWHVSDKALQKTIELCADICKRNDIKKLNFTGDKNGNLVAHRYYQATACPGEYLYSKFSYIADEVNKLLGVAVAAKTYTVVSNDTLSKIGAKTGVNWKTIAELNGIKFPYIIKKGQVLKLSEGTVETKPSTSTTATTPSATTTSVPLKVTATKKGVQEFLNTYYGTEIKKVVGALLVVDGLIGAKSKLALGVAIQVELNKLGAGLVVDGKIGANSANAWNKYVGTLKRGSKGIFVTLWQCLIVANGVALNGGIDGDFGTGSANASNALFAKAGLSRDSSVSSSDINALL